MFKRLIEAHATTAGQQGTKKKQPLAQ